MSLNKKILVFLCIFTLVLPLFCACASDHPSEDSTKAATKAETTAPAADPIVIEGDFKTETFAEPLCIFGDGKTVYKLVRQDTTSDRVIGLYQQIIKAMKTGGVTLYHGEADWVKPGTDVSGWNELLIGNTNRAESRAVMDKLGYDEFAITLLNNKIVVAANTENKLCEAVTYLCDNLLSFSETDGRASAYLTGTYYSHSDKKGFLGDGSLEEYSIVYKTATKIGKDNAETLQKAIKKAWGVELELVSEINAKSGKEIVVGPVNRDICKKFSADTDDDNYVIATDGADLVIMGNSDDATTKAVEGFIKLYVNKYYSNTLSIEPVIKLQNSVYVFNDDPARAEGTDVRIMSFNLLCELWDDKAQIKGRDSIVGAILRTYAPDVAGIQEISDKWYVALDAVRGDYEFTSRKTERGLTNFSTLIYNKNTVKLLASGVSTFSKGNNTKLRLATWGYFEHIATGKKFVAVTTHWDLSSNVEYQMVHSNEMAELVLKLGSKYGCEVITTGDYNSKPDTYPYKNYVDKTQYSDAKFAADVVHNPCKGTHSLGASLSGDPGDSIDHIFGSAGVHFLYYNCLIDQIVCDASDHNPIYADIKLK